MARTQIFEGEADPAYQPLVFIEKQVIAATIPDAYLDGSALAISFSYCEMYGPCDGITNVCSSFIPVDIFIVAQVHHSDFSMNAVEVVYFDETISLLSTASSNYYHFLTEYVVRLAFS